MQNKYILTLFKVETLKNIGLKTSNRIEPIYLYLLLDVQAIVRDEHHNRNN
jgi:hypothetical protein